MINIKASLLSQMTHLFKCLVVSTNYRGLYFLRRIYCSKVKKYLLDLIKNNFCDVTSFFGTSVISGSFSVDPVVSDMWCIKCSGMLINKIASESVKQNCTLLDGDWSIWRISTATFLNGWKILFAYRLKLWIQGAVT